MGAPGAWHPPKSWTSPLAPADFEVLNTNWHPQSSFYVRSGTLIFKFLTQALHIIGFVFILRNNMRHPVLLISAYPVWWSYNFSLVAINRENWFRLCGVSLFIFTEGPRSVGITLPKMLPVLVLAFFVNVQATPNSNYIQKFVFLIPFLETKSRNHLSFSWHSGTPLYASASKIQHSTLLTTKHKTRKCNVVI